MSLKEKNKNKFKCPDCGATQMSVVATTQSAFRVRRVRECKNRHCQMRFETAEFIVCHKRYLDGE